jgi:hypothetical protein
LPSGLADGSDTPLVVDNFPRGTAPGEYRFTPGTPFAFAPGWGGVTPFVLDDSSQFRPGPPYPVTGRKYAADLNEIKALGGDGVATPSARTPEQTQVALFWVESSPLQWNRIARTVSARLDPWAQARLFALLNMALADGYVSSFETKYHYDYWRPVTAIRAADTDGNPRTSADPTWTPLVTTPPIPDYDSAHAVQGGAGSTVLERFFGTDHIGFTTCSLTLPAGSTCTDPSPVTRSYASFSAAARRRTASRASSWDSTSARRWTKGSSRATGSATSRSTASCAPCAEHLRSDRAAGHRWRGRILRLAAGVLAGEVVLDEHRVLPRTLDHAQEVGHRRDRL